MATRKLVISYEYADRQTLIEFERPPSFYNDPEYVIFAKGVLADREITYDRILEVYITETFHSVFDEGLKALADET
jgi:hypothetical protein